MKKILAVFDKAMEWLVFLCSLGFVVLCFLQVVFRYVVNNSIPWSEEASRFLFVFVVFIGGIICVKEKRHTGVDLLLQSVSGPVKKYYSVGISALMFVFAVFLMKAGWDLAMHNMFQVSSALRIPLGYIYMVIPFSGLFMAMNCVRVAVADWKAEEKEEVEG